VLAAGRATSDAHAPSPATDEADVWFMQHMAGHLLQTTSILDLSQDRITRPKLARVAAAINQRGASPPHPAPGMAGQPGAGPVRPPAGAQQPQGIRPCQTVAGPWRPLRPGLPQGDDGPPPRWQQTRRHRAPRGHPARGPPARPAAAGRATEPDHDDDGLDARLVQSGRQAIDGQSLRPVRRWPAVTLVVTRCRGKKRRRNTRRISR
jgi:hypothetical protein